MTERKNTRPPASAEPIVPNYEKSSCRNSQQKEHSPEPAHANLLLVMPLQPGTAHVRGELSPVAIIVKDLSGCGIRAYKPLCPVFLVKTDGSGITAHNTLIQDSARKLTKMLLLQRQKMVP